MSDSSLQLTKNNVGVLKIQPALDNHHVIYVTEGKTTVTYSASELELRILYEWLKGKYAD